MSGQNTFTRIGTGLAALLLLLGTMLLTGCGASGGNGAAGSGAAADVSEAYAIYPHFSDQKVTTKNHTLTLSNNQKNQFDFVYTLSTGGKTLYESQKIKPGTKETWDLSANCTKSCSLDITITAWSLADGKEQNSVTQTIQVTLPEQAK